MGRYFNPATLDAILSAGGRKISEDRIVSHSALAAQLREGEALAMFNDRIAFLQVADVTEPAEFQEFESQYRDGAGIAHRSFWAMPRDAFRH